MDEPGKRAVRVRQFEDIFIHGTDGENDATMLDVGAYGNGKRGHWRLLNRARGGAWEPFLLKTIEAFNSFKHCVWRKTQIPSSA